MRRLSAKAIAAVPGLRALRAKGLLRPSVLAPVAVVLAVGAAAILVPHESHDPEPTAASKPGGETVIAKFAKAKAQTSAMFSEPTPVSRLLSMALAPVPTIAPPVEEEPNLAGLSEIPKELIWNRPPKEEEEEGKRPSFAAFSQARDNLPWDAVEPVPFSPLAEAPAAVKPASGPKTAGAARLGPVPLPGGDTSDVVNWLKTKVTEIKGADRSRPLYHFELWLEPPKAVKGRLVGVSYAFSTPAIRPQSQASSDRGTGFRISAGGLACADEIVLTLRFDDGRVETVSVDGCKLLS